jgi:hypothetical protein
MLMVDCQVLAMSLRLKCKPYVTVSSLSQGKVWVSQIKAYKLLKACLA